MIYKKIIVLDDKINSLLNKLEKNSAEDAESDELVLFLLTSVKERQFLVEELLLHKDDQHELTVIYELSGSFSLRTKKLLRHRQDLIQLRKSNKRKIDAYKNISSDR
ncbi:MAG: hypothetical protein V7690_01665 [Shewanella sp.]|uniref:hypothetical protein n=1 Tax=Shewanella sp. TaxID=50422 RepID=UPI003002BB91